MQDQVFRNLLPLDRHCDECIAVKKANNALQFAVQAEDALSAEFREAAGDGFDRQSEIVGDIAARHHHIEFAASRMTIGHFIDKGGNALQCALLGDDELFVLCLCEVRQGNVEKVYRNDCVLIGAKGPDTGFADGFCEIGSNIARFQTEPLTLAAEGQDVSLPAGRQAIDAHRTRFDLINRKRMFAFAVDRLVGLELDRLILGSPSSRAIAVPRNYRLLYDRVVLKHMCRPHPYRRIGNRGLPRYSRYPLRIITEARDHRQVYKAIPLDESDTKISREVSMASEEEGDGRAIQDSASVRAQLDLILASPEFLAPERGRRFLQYIVEETLEGRSEQLKAYTIAQAVFGRDASFDAQSDPVVRIEAGRIRRALERYYLVCGRNDPIRITVPKGGYAPHFSRGGNSSDAGEISVLQNRENKRRRLGRERPVSYRDLLLPIGIPALFGVVAILALVRPLEAYLSPPKALPAPATSALKSKIRILVEPFAALGGTVQGADFVKGLADQLIAKLMKVENLVVLAPGRSRTEMTGSLFNLQGSALVEGMILHLHVRLINDADGAVIWANQYDRDLRGQTILDVEDEIAAQIAMEISNSQRLSGTGTDP